ncbi:hypothetical protein G9A89_020219 [Geosiphon pyriformis]|nr:hypothetical protein G9A89_020219 [Geosiphon pyriformis]
MGITAHNLSDLLVFYGEKSCFIGHNSSSYVCDRCAVICFGDEASKLAAIGTIPIFKGVSLRWAGLSLACCSQCKQFGHISVNCLMGGNSGGRGRQVVSDQDRVHLVRIYKKKMASIVWPVSFGDKTWAQVASGSSFRMVLLDTSGVGSTSDMNSLSMSFESLDVSDLGSYLASLKCFLELLTDQVSGIMKKLSFVELVPLVPSFCVSPSDVSVPVVSVVNSDMALDGRLTLFIPSVSGADVSDAIFSSSGSKVLTSKVSGLESKMSVLKASIGSVLFWFSCSFFIPMSNLVWKFAMCNIWGINVPAKQANIVYWHVSSGNMVSFVTETKLKSFAGPWIKDKFDGVQIFTSGLDVGYFSAGVAVIMNNFLARHVSKIEEISGRVVSLSITVLGLYVSAFSGTYFGQASEINFFIAKAVNTSTFIVLGGDFNESRSGRSASFKFCLGLSLCNSRGVEKTIDYIFVSENLSSTVAKHWIGPVSEFFDINHSAVIVLVGLGELLNAQLNSLCKQANKDHWKFKIRDVDVAKWNKFKDCVSDKLLLIIDFFSETKAGGNLDTMWAILKREMVESADEMFARHCVLDWPFCKVVFDHLVINDNLVLESEEIKSKYMPLDYVRDNAFSGVIRKIVIEELLLVVGGLPDGKAAGLSGIPNKLWKHNDEVVLSCLLVLLNACLSVGRVPPYDWDGVLTNTHLIALIETARKILSKVLSDQIFFVCSKFGVLHDDNFSVLKGTSTQSLVFAVGAVVKDALEKDRELWLVLQNMASLQRIKMCDKFIRFFDGIHKGRFNRMMTDFGLSDEYYVCDGLDQGEVKRHKQIFGYWISSKFVSKSDQIEGSGRLSFYFTAGAFVDDTIWVGNCQAATQNILDIASKFFVINDIFINNKKTVAISINQSVKIASLSINGLPVLITKKSEAHHYLGIFLSTERLSKPSVAKVHSDVCFFANVVLRKAIIDKQFSYLVSAVLQPIVSYHT